MLSVITSSILAALGAATAVSAHSCPKPGHDKGNGSDTGGQVKCPIVLEGRVPVSASLTHFDTANGLFNPDYVKGNNLSWSDILLFPPNLPNSRFDTSEHKSFEVTIDDKSIFMKQHGFRRAGLQFANDSNSGSPGYVGVKTLHWSVKQDQARPFNLSHEYLNAWHEAGDYSANQFMFQTGQLIDQPGVKRNTYKFLDRNSTLLWSTPIKSSAWQNFAVTLNIDANTIQIYYSSGSGALKPVTKAIPADLSGEGQYQIGILKKPTGTSDVANSGFQESPFNEGLIYGSMFVEDSKGGCISL